MFTCRVLRHCFFFSVCLVKDLPRNGEDCQRTCQKKISATIGFSLVSHVCLGPWASLDLRYTFNFAIHFGLELLEFLNYRGLARQ